MKKIILLFCLITVASRGHSQINLPIDFESSVITSDFVDFSGGAATVISNPQSVGVNTSATVAQIIRNGGEIWAGSKLILDNNLDFSVLSVISMKVYTTAPIGTVVKFKLEGTGETELDSHTTVSGEWETLSWDFHGQPTNFNELVFMFDFGNTGDGSANSTFLFDDIEQIDPFGGLDQMDLPVDFESASVFYALTSFEGNESAIIQDPNDTNNTIGEITKPVTAGSSAGTTIGTPAGFESDIPFTLTESKMYVGVWSPDANIPVRLKVEDSSDPTHTCETETNTTVAGDWEVLEFDFVNEAPGTASLSFGLDNGWTYNMASIFFNFGTDGATAGEKKYYFDDVSFNMPLSIPDFIISELKVYPNPTVTNWHVQLNQEISKIELYDLLGKRLLSLQPNKNEVTINASTFNNGIYIAKIYSKELSKTVKLLKY